MWLRIHSGSGAPPCGHRLAECSTKFVPMRRRFWSVSCMMASVLIEARDLVALALVVFVGRHVVGAEHAGLSCPLPGCPARLGIAGTAAPGWDDTPLLYRMTSAPDGGITTARHLIFNLCAVASAKSTKARAHPMAKIPKLGRVIAREQGVKDPEAVFLTVEWVDDEGYRVVGDFRLISWGQPPRAIGEKMQAALSKPPLVVYHRPRAVEQVAGKRDHPRRTTWLY